MFFRENALSVGFAATSPMGRGFGEAIMPLPSTERLGSVGDCFRREDDILPYGDRKFFLGVFFAMDGQGGQKRAGSVLDPARIFWLLGINTYRPCRPRLP